MRVFVTTNLGEEFKKFVLNKLRGPKVAAMLTWFSPSGHEKLRPACCWAAESLMGKHRGFESVVIDEDILRGLFGRLASAEHVAVQARAFRGSAKQLRLLDGEKRQRETRSRFSRKRRWRLRPKRRRRPRRKRRRRPRRRRRRRPRPRARRWGPALL